MENQLHLLTSSYALNALEPEERKEFERYALSNPETSAEVRSLSETAALLAFNTAEEAPPAALKINLMAAIRNTPQVPATSVVRDISSATGVGSRNRAAGHRPTGEQNRAQNKRWVPALSAAAALAVFAGVGVGGWAVGQNSNQQELAQELLTLQQQQAASAAQQEAMLSIVSSPDAKIARTALGNSGSVTVASSSKADKAAVMVQGVPALPADKTYELWFISAAGAVPAGLMTSDDPAVPGMQVLNGSLAGATHVGITVEPAGGSPAPTTTPILVQAI